jgi:hypothetical protein
MKWINRIISKKELYAAMAIAAVLVLLLMPVSATAADFDLDGFTDAEEMAGITPLGSTVTVPACNEASPPAMGTAERNVCVDWRTPDLFVILELATYSGGPYSLLNTGGMDPYSNDPAVNYLGMISDSVIGLGAAVHTLSPDQALSSRLITYNQKAARVRESLITQFYPSGGQCMPECEGKKCPSIELGYTSPSRSQVNEAFTETVIKTQNIADFIDWKCTDKTGCYDGLAGMDGNGDPVIAADSPGACRDNMDALDIHYVRNLFVHEIGHQVLLASEYSRKYGWHFAPETLKVMEQWTKVNTSGDQAIFEISTIFDPVSQASWILGGN